MNLLNFGPRCGVSAKKIRNEREHVVHLFVAARVRRLSGRHRVGAHPKTFDPSVDELIRFVERDVVVNEIAQPPSHLRPPFRSVLTW